MGSKQYWQIWRNVLVYYSGVNTPVSQADEEFSLILNGLIVNLCKIESKHSKKTLKSWLLKTLVLRYNQVQDD